MATYRVHYALFAKQINILVVDISRERKKIRRVPNSPQIGVLTALSR